MICLSPCQQENIRYDSFMAGSKEADWGDRAKRFLKAELKRADVTYEELAKRLKKHGLEETEASIANKLSRGTFPATFFLATVAALGLDSVRIDEI
jgi:hypothetical protein